MIQLKNIIIFVYPEEKQFPETCFAHNYSLIMKKKLFITTFLSIFLLAIFVSCKSTSNLDDSTLPKDISERPSDENSKKYDEALLDELRNDIESIISKENCTKSSEWTFSAMGSKACGGPTKYIAYPRKLENIIKPKISNYTQKMSEYNKKYNITSDCMMTAEPTGVRCDNGNAVLTYQ